MKYFASVKSYEDLKAKYRTLALANHPDKGGSEDAMKAINNEYDVLFPIWKRRSKVESAETAESTRSEFYTQNGWKGTNYKCGRSTKEIAQLVREYCKQEHNDYRFSVTYDSYSGGSSITVAMTEAPEEVLTSESDNGYIQLNQYHLDRDERMTSAAANVMQDINRFICSYRYDDSDSMIDYFNTNFYYHLNIGRWNKPVKIVPRIKTNAEPVEYETVTVTETKTRKAIQAFPIPAPAEFAEGQYFRIESSNFNYGVCRGYVYQIRRVSGIVFANRMDKALKKQLTGSANPANTFNVDPAKLRGWVEKGAISFVELRETTVTEEVKREVRRPKKCTSVSTTVKTPSGAAYSTDETSTEEQTQNSGAIPSDYTVTPDTDTRDGSALWVVRFAARMSVDEYKATATALKTIGGVYSKFKHGFIFRADPTEDLASLSGATSETTANTTEADTAPKKAPDNENRAQQEQREQERIKAIKTAARIEDASTDIICALRLRPGEYAYSQKYRQQLEQYIIDNGIAITEEVINALEYDDLKRIIRSILENQRQTQAG